MASSSPFIRFLLVAFYCSLSSLVFGSAVPANTTIGAFGPLVPYQPFNDWLYPLNQSIPIQLSLGNGSLALSVVY
jgi:hypothetical protein